MYSDEAEGSVATMGMITSGPGLEGEMMEASRGNSDHGEGDPAQTHLLIQDIRPAAEGSLPEGITEHDGASIFVVEESAERGPDAKRAIEIPGHFEYSDAFDAAGELEKHFIIAREENIAQAFRTFGEEMLKGERKCRLNASESVGMDVLQAHQLFGMVDREVAEQKDIDGGEDERVGADSECE